MLCLGWTESGLSAAPGEAGMGFFKGNLRSLWGDRGGVSLLFFWSVASEFQDMSQDNRLGKGPGCSQVQEGQTDHWPLWLVSDVYCARWERASCKPRAIINRVRITESWAVQWVGKLAWLRRELSGGLGNCSDPFKGMYSFSVRKKESSED